MRRDRAAASVVVPCHRAAVGLAASLEAIKASRGGPYEVVVVDDGSRDGAGQVAEGLGFRSVRLESCRGPGAARNAGVALTSGEILLFVDSDVRVEPAALSRLATRLRSDGSLAACFGLYAERAGASGLVSDFRNLLHRYSHLGAAGKRVSSFFTAVGAVRREALEAVGGFPAVGALEDVIVGDRLARRGLGIALETGAEAVHMKPYTLLGVVASVFRDRAVPWGYLAATRGLLRDEFATSRSERLSGCLAVAGVFTLALAAALVLLAPPGPVPWPPPARLSLAIACGVAAIVALAGLVIVEAPLYRWLARRRGWLYVVRAFPVHLAYLVSASLGFGLGYALGLARLRVRRLTKGVEAVE